jgi:hypothetical protein
MGDMLDLVQ